MTVVRRLFNKLFTCAVLWIDSHAADPNAKHEQVFATQAEADAAKAASEKTDWLRCIPFIGLHLACLAVFYVGFSWAALAMAVVLYLVRMHAITGWYHRYFSHRTFKTSRFWQFVWAFIGNSSAQRGPLWWAAHHRHHHRYSDEVEDIHSPKQKGFWWSHMGWFTATANFRCKLELVPDLVKFPELVLLDRFDVLAPLLLGFATFYAGVGLQHLGFDITGGQALVWGFFVSTMFTAHATFTINSLSHVFGSRRYETGDTSKNNFWLALLTMGEGWHNNHHHYQSTVRQGFRWYQLDVTWYLLVMQSWLRLVWDLKPVPEHVISGVAVAKESAQVATPSGGTPTPGLIPAMLKSREPAA
jgi:stearoyl-CoA desaturase (Delta-9 desaturase)